MPMAKNPDQAFDDVPTKTAALSVYGYARALFKRMEDTRETTISGDGKLIKKRWNEANLSLELNKTRISHNPTVRIVWRH